MRYRTASFHVEASQFQPGVHLPLGAIEAPDHSAVVNTPAGKVTLKAGDFVLHDGFTFRVMGAAEFASAYEEAPATQFKIEAPAEEKAPEEKAPTKIEKAIKSITKKKGK